jgi:predicted hydrocarbon binding protein
MVARCKRRAGSEPQSVWCSRPARRHSDHLFPIMTEPDNRPSTLDDLRARPVEADDSHPVHPAVSLILLETIRDMDLPPEYLEEENVTESMPRRFGLSDVVASQIRRFEEAVRTKESQPPSVVIDLLRLVIRRPDADEVCEEAGRRVAHHFWGRRTRISRVLLRWTPRVLSVPLGYRRLGKVLEEVVGDAEVVTHRKPLVVELRQSLTSRADPGGAACTFYAGLISELLRLHIGRDYRARHVRCATRADEPCEWQVVVGS